MCLHFSIRKTVVKQPIDTYHGRFCQVQWALINFSRFSLSLAGLNSPLNNPFIPPTKMRWSGVGTLARLIILWRRLPSSPMGIALSRFSSSADSGPFPLSWTFGRTKEVSCSCEGVRGRKCGIFRFSSFCLWSTCASSGILNSSNAIVYCPFPVSI